MQKGKIKENSRDFLISFIGVLRNFRSGRDRETVNVCLVNSTHASRMAAAVRVIFNPV